MSMSNLGGIGKRLAKLNFPDKGKFKTFKVVSGTESHPKQVRKSSMGCGVIMLLAMIVFAGFFIWIASDLFISLTWQETPCQILQSGIDESDPAKPRLKLTFGYRWKGSEFQSTKIHSYSSDHDDYSSMAKFVARYPEGSKSVCYVNPKNPAEAVLQKKIEPLSALFLVIPLGMVAFATVFAVTIRRKARQPSKSISQEKGRESKAVGMVFFAIFGLAGLLFMTPFYQAISGILGSGNWAEVPCHVIYSGVKSDGDTYQLNILYSYQYGGKKYKSNRYGFSKISTSGRSGKEVVVGKYPAGSESVCYVNPSDPFEAVLTRDLTGDLLFALIPLVFVVVGLVGFFVSARGRKTMQARQGNRAISEGTVRMRVTTTNSMEGWVPLKNASPRIGSVIAALCISLFWNGIISVFIAQAISDWQRGRKDWFLMIFLIPFVVVGLGMIVWLLKSIVRLFLALPVISIYGGELQTGSKTGIKWRVSGNKVPSRLRFLLKGREIAKERSGSNTTTHESCFYEQPIHEAIGTMETRGGETSISLPHELPPSFKAGMNEVIWTLKVKGEKEGMLGVDEEYLIDVVPGKPPFFQAKGTEAENAELSSVIEESAGLELNLEKQTFLPEETIHLIACWNVPRLMDSIQVRLFYYTEGKGERDVKVVEERTLSQKAASGESPIDFSLPKSPSSMHGKLVSVFWAIELMHTGTDEVIKVPIVVSASGKPIRLNVVEPEMKKSQKRFGVWRRTR